MKILFISEYFPASEKVGVRGGVEARCFFVAKELAKDHDITVISSQEKGIKKEDRFCNIRVIRCGRERSYSQKGSVLGRLSFMLDAYHRAKKIDSDIIEGENYISYLPAYLAARKRKVPSVAMYADVLIGDWVKSFGIVWGLFWESVERIILKLQWDRFIAISRSTEKKLVRHGVKKDRISVVYCPVDLSEYKGKARKFDRPTVTCIARLVTYKQVDVLIQAIAIVRKKIPGIQCRIIGSGPEKENLTGLIGQLKLEKNVEIIGYVADRKDLLGILKSSHLFSLPSSVEGFGIVTVEAMASGVPYVSSDIPVTAEITENGKGGLLFRTGNPDDLAEKIIMLLNNKKLYSQKVKECRELAKKYSLSAIGKELSGLYNSLGAKK